MSIKKNYENVRTVVVNIRDGEGHNWVVILREHSKGMAGGNFEV